MVIEQVVIEKLRALPAERQTRDLAIQSANIETIW